MCKRHEGRDMERLISVLQEAKDLTREFVYVCLYTCLCEEVIEMTLVNFETESPVDRWMERKNRKMRFNL